VEADPRTTSLTRANRRRKAWLTFIMATLALQPLTAGITAPKPSVSAPSNPTRRRQPLVKKTHHHHDDEGKDQPQSDILWGSPNSTAGRSAGAWVTLNATRLSQSHSASAEHPPT